ncbi:DUF262 domain-containing protein [Lunatibacter salilacus]|uniref:DUF262 domain-containing protein n=1 Tax=Lunatibacter salilacus TaxID=2483804 RepID=UPI00131DC0EA|nr:DUF262 domain-containing protein [Lunatibacter salilacus]
MKTEYIDFRPISDLKNLHFVVKDYQRGYKWEDQQIRDLLNDIHNHTHGKYCLQPLLVHQRNDQVELIDGQQRVTSIYLILHFLQDNSFYSISYQTREKTREFLDTGLQLLDDYSNSTWETFINQNGSFNNVDIYFFFKVYKEIKKWFDESKADRVEFFAKLKNSVHIIWYDISLNNPDISPEAVFLNLNAGKIPLTNSELIKALFILDIQKQNSNEIGKLKAFDLASDWDRIENQLQNDTFWSFICDNDYYNNLDTRIDLIIDLANQVPKIDTEDQRKTSYKKYDKKFQTGEQLDWQAIKQTFNKIEEWYTDKKLFHYIGFLIVTKYKRLSSIVEMSKGPTKEEFKELLLREIRDQLSKTKDIEGEKIAYHRLENLHYEKYRIACQNILLLLNIEDYLNRSSDEKFPFNLYLNEKWSVEHINPQNPRGFKTIRDVIGWLKSYQTYFDKITDPDSKEVVGRISSLIDNFSSKRDLDSKFADFRFEKNDRLVYEEVIEKISDELSLHEIGNLCLLDRNTNSKLGNKIFTDKRKEILEIYYQKSSDDEITYIPNGTKDVFTKAFSKEEENITDKIFGIKDMEEYKNHIKDQLNKYFPIES